MAYCQVTGGSCWPREAGGVPNWPQVLSAVYETAVSVAAERRPDAPVRHTRHAAGCRCCSVASAQLQLGLELGNSAGCGCDGDGNDGSPATRRWLIQSGRSACAQSIKNIRIEHVRCARAKRRQHKTKTKIHSYPYTYTYISIRRADKSRLGYVRFRLESFRLRDYLDPRSFRARSLLGGEPVRS